MRNKKHLRAEECKNIKCYENEVKNLTCKCKYLLTLLCVYVCTCKHNTLKKIIIIKLSNED